MKAKKQNIYQILNNFTVKHINVKFKKKKTLANNHQNVHYHNNK